MIYPLLISFVWGSIPIIIKIYLSYFPHILIILLQSIVILISSLIYIYFFNYKDFMEGIKNVTYRNIFLLALTYFIASFVCNLLYLNVLKKYDIASILLIFILTPIITIVMSSLILNELLNIKQIFGCILVSLGLFLIFYFKDVKKLE